MKLTKLNPKGSKINVKYFNLNANPAIYYQNERKCRWLDRDRINHYLFRNGGMYYNDKNDKNEPDDTEEMHARYVGFLSQKAMNDRRDPRRTTFSIKDNLEELKIRLANINGGVIINKKYHRSKTDLPVTDIGVKIEIPILGNDKPLFQQMDFPKDTVELKAKGMMTFEGNKLKLISKKSKGDFNEKDEKGRLKGYFLNMYSIMRYHCP